MLPAPEKTQWQQNYQDNGEGDDGDDEGDDNDEEGDDVCDDHQGGWQRN